MLELVRDATDSTQSVKSVNGALTLPLVAGLATDAATRRAVFEVRYDAYLRYGHIASNADGMFSDRYDELPNMLTAVLRKAGVVAGTVRVGVARADGNDILPAMEVFADDMRLTMRRCANTQARPRIVEVGRIARGSAYEHDLAIIHGMFRITGFLILHFDPEIVFSAVRLHHRPMYRRMGFEQVSEPRRYPGLTCDMVLMAYFKRRFGEAIESLPYLRGVDEDVHQARRLVAGEQIAIAAGAPGLRRQRGNGAVRREAVGLAGAVASL